MTDNAMKPYWASVPVNEIANNILDKVEDYYEFMQMTGRLDLYRRSWTYYYRPQVEGAMLNPVGEQGELTAMVVNDYRNLLSHLETLTTQQDIVFEPQATNSDQKSQEQVILASGLLDYYLREKRADRFIIAAVKESLIGGEGFVRTEWDANDGKVYGQTPTGAPVRQGDIKYSNYNILSCVRDVTKLSANQDVWYILRDFRNKYDLAAQYPEIENLIINDSPDALELIRTTLLNYEALVKSDNIPVYTLIHEPTPAMPNGRYTQCLTNQTILADGPIPYNKAHISRIAPDEQQGTPFGYTPAYDLLPIQEAQDILYSTVITNQAANGVSLVTVPKGHDLSTSQISSGLSLLECDYNLGKPEALNLTSTPPEIFNFIGMLKKDGETVTNVNSVVRGNPEASLESGSALALVQSQAIQASMPLQRSYAHLSEDVGTDTIDILKQYAATPRVAAIVGESNRPYMRSFIGDDLSLINRVTVKVGNPMTKTTGGKLNLADIFMKYGMVKNPDQYTQVLQTGRLEPIIDGPEQQNILIKGENEELARGKPQRALLTDDHAKHILEHQIVTASPEARQDPNSPPIQVTLEHIQEHLTLAQSPGYQMIAAMLGHQVMVPPMQQLGMGAPMQAQNPVEAKAESINMPNMPNPPPTANPQTADVINQQKQA